MSAADPKRTFVNLEPFARSMYWLGMKRVIQSARSASRRFGCGACFDW